LAFDPKCPPYALQTTLTNFLDWCDSLQLSLCLPKCAVLHLGRRNPKFSYTANNTKVTTVDYIRDLGVIIDSSLSFSLHCNSIVAKALSRLNTLFRAFHSHSPDLLIRGYITYVRPILETFSPVWSPHLEQDSNNVESVQRKFAHRLYFRCFPNQCNPNPPSYPVRLEALNIQPLHDRRQTADRVLLFKIMTGLVDASPSDFFTVSENRLNLRGNPTRISSVIPRSDMRKYFFTNRVCSFWNSLDTSQFNYPNLPSFLDYLSRT